MSFHALVLAAGQGTRMRSKLPKVLHPVLDRPMVLWAVKAALDAGASDVTVVVGHGREQVQAALTEAFPDASVDTVVQHEQRGTADAVLSARGRWSAQSLPVAVLYGDVPNVPPELLLQLAADHAAGDALVSLVTAQAPSPGGYGRIVRERDGQVSRIVEARDATPEELAIEEVNVGIYLMDPTFLEETLPSLQPNNAQGELYLTDLVALAAQRGKCVALQASDIAPLEGVNDRVQLAQAEAVAQERILRHWQREGVSFESPSSVRVGPEVVLERDVTVAAQVHLLGATHVREGSRIDVGCVLRDTSVGRNAHLRPYTVATDAVLGDATGVGPFAHLRPATVLGEQVHIGNFVETKKTTFGDGAKASHLAYLGDAEIGEGSNIGAGTITCNYDGTHKHRTVLGREVFVGSDSQLVAPVTIGDSAYIGAGSTITKDVPAGSLAISRVPQRVIENWVALRKGSQDK